MTRRAQAKGRNLALLVVICILVSLIGHGQANSSQNSNARLTYGSILKLINPSTKLYLHSHDVFFGRGGVMSVTGCEIDDLGSYWQIREELKKATKTFQEDVKCGDKVTLASVVHSYYLRSEDTQFGLTTELLPMVHGINENGIDDKINWQIQCVDRQEGQTVQYNDQIRFKHHISGKYISIDPMYVYTDGNCRGCSILHQAEPHALDSHDDTTTVLVIGDGIIFDPYYVQADNEKKGENFE